LKEAVHKSESQLIGLSDNIEILKHQLEKAMQEKRLKPEDTTSEGKYSYKIQLETMCMTIISCFLLLCVILFNMSSI
jgi:hypothetical protein